MRDFRVELDPEDSPIFMPHRLCRAVVRMSEEVEAGR